jgi:hypothetical protein
MRDMMTLGEAANVIGIIEMRRRSDRAERVRTTREASNLRRVSAAEVERRFERRAFSPRLVHPGGHSHPAPGCGDSIAKGVLRR